MSEERHCGLQFELIIGKTVAWPCVSARSMKKSARPRTHNQNRDRAYTALPPELRGRRARGIVRRYWGHFNSNPSSAQICFAMPHPPPPAMRRDPSRGLDPPHLPRQWTPPPPPPPPGHVEQEEPDTGKCAPRAVHDEVRQPQRLLADQVARCPPMAGHSAGISDLARPRRADPLPVHVQTIALRQLRRSAQPDRPWRRSRRTTITVPSSRCQVRRKR